MPSNAAAFLSISILLIVMPGQDTALIIRNTLLGQRRSGVATAFGVTTGLAVWTGSTSAGLAALLLASAPLFHAIKLAGAVYLIFLGAQALRAALRPSPPSGPAGDAAPQRALPPARAYRQGLISNLGNPKIAIFFTSLLPQFAPQRGPAFWSLLGLGLVFCVLTLGWLTAYACVVERAAGYLRRSGVRRALDAVMGAVLVAFGVRLATASR
jgi:threonine/homoserine/homoserine lactone efflux protein